MTKNDTEKPDVEEMLEAHHKLEEKIVDDNLRVVTPLLRVFVALLIIMVLGWFVLGFALGPTYWICFPKMEF